jgi:hypothetical protein
MRKVNSMNRRIASLVCGAAVTLSVFLSGGRALDAQSAFHPARAFVSPRLAPRPLQPIGRIHTFFGTIVRLAPRALWLRLRTGRVILVNSDIAIAADRYSAPLFVSKIVVIRGQVDPNGVLHAEFIEKLPQLDPGTGPDR